MLDKELVKYISENIIPMYSNFDDAHNMTHVKSVIERSKELFDFLNDDNLNENIVFTIAAYHDTGMSIERKGHAKHSGEIVRGDINLRKWFLGEEIETIAQACEDHSTSLNREPRSIYGKIVCDADKDRLAEVSLKRIWDYRKNIDISDEQKRKDAFEYLNYKFGENGIVKFYIQDYNNSTYMDEMRKLATDEKYFNKKIDEITKNIEK